MVVLSTPFVTVITSCQLPKSRRIVDRLGACVSTVSQSRALAASICYSQNHHEIRHKGPSPATNPKR